MSKTDTLDEARLLKLIDAYGSDINAWPEDLAEAARPALEHPSEAVASALLQAGDLDALLSELDAPEPPVHLYRSILDSAPVQSRRRSGLSFGAWGARAMAATSALAVGLSLGLGTAAASDSLEDPFAGSSWPGLEISAFADDLEEFAE